jgi:hypothetical protein
MSSGKPSTSSVRSVPAANIHKRLVDYERAHVRDARRTVEHELPLPDESTMAQRLVLPGGSPTDVAVRREQSLAVRHSLARLSDTDRPKIRSFLGARSSKTQACPATAADESQMLISKIKFPKARRACRVWHLPDPALSMASPHAGEPRPPALCMRVGGLPKRFVS